MTDAPRDLDRRLARAAGLLRAAESGGAGVVPDRALVADLLARIAPLAPWWAEAYAAPWVPVIEAAVRLAEQVIEEVDGGAGVDSDDRGGEVPDARV